MFFFFCVVLSFLMFGNLIAGMSTGRLAFFWELVYVWGFVFQSFFFVVVFILFCTICILNFYFQMVIESTYRNSCVFVFFFLIWDMESSYCMSPAADVTLICKYNTVRSTQNISKQRKKKCMFYWIPNWYDWWVSPGRLTNDHRLNHKNNQYSGCNAMIVYVM